MSNDFDKPNNLTPTLEIEDWNRGNADAVARMFTGISPILNPKTGFKQFHSDGYFTVYSEGTSLWSKLDFTKIDFDTELQLVMSSGRLLSFLTSPNGVKLHSANEIQLTTGVVNSVANLTLIDTKTGVNQETPAYTLDVFGDINFTGALTYAGAPFDPGTGVTDHRQLTNRNDIDQHSQASITGLVGDLDDKLDASGGKVIDTLKFKYDTTWVSGTADALSIVSLVGGSQKQLNIGYASGDNATYLYSYQSNFLFNKSILVYGNINPKNSTSALGNSTPWKSLNAINIYENGVALSSKYNNYIHPTTEGNLHIPSGGDVGQFLRNVGSGNVGWVDAEEYDTPPHNQLPDRDVADTHPLASITGLQSALDDKIDDSQVLTDVPLNALFTDTVYTHPTTAGNKHIPSGGNTVNSPTFGRLLINGGDGIAQWGSSNFELINSTQADAGLRFGNGLLRNDGKITHLGLQVNLGNDVDQKQSATEHLVIPSNTWTQILSIRTAQMNSGTYNFKMQSSKLIVTGLFAFDQFNGDNDSTQEIILHHSRIGNSGERYFLRLRNITGSRSILEISANFVVDIYDVVFDCRRLS